MIDLDKLDFLRKKTKLSPLKIYRIEKLKSAISKATLLINQREKANFGIDYSPALELEYYYRLEAWKVKMFNFWYTNYYNVNFDTFIEEALEDNVRERKEVFYERRIK